MIPGATTMAEPKKTMNGAGSSMIVMKLVLTAALASIVTGIGSWVTLGRHAVTHEEVREIVENALAKGAVTRVEVREIVDSGIAKVQPPEWLVNRVNQLPPEWLIQRIERLEGKVDLILTRTAGPSNSDWNVQGRPK